MTRLPPRRFIPGASSGASRVADFRIFTVERSIASSPEDSAPHPFHRIRCVDWAQILPITADGNAVLVRQYRHGPNA